MAIIELTELNYKQGNKTILDNINLIVNSGERWIVMGANGCGKTTLASIISGYRGKFEGILKLFGTELIPENTEQIRKRIGFVSESYFSKLYKNELGMEIILGGIAGQLGEKEEQNDTDILYAHQLLKSFGIGVRGEYPYNLLSKGQQQKVLLARAFMKPKELLVLDEPCTGLDILSRMFLSNTLKDLSEKTGTTMVYVTHHTEEIRNFFTHALLLADGTIHSMGKIGEIMNAENLSDFFHCGVEVGWKNDYLNIQLKQEYKMDDKLWKFYN